MYIYFKIIAAENEINCANQDKTTDPRPQNFKMNTS